MKMDLKGWKKVTENDQHAILRNDNGHELKIAKKALKGKLKDQLAELEMVEQKKVAPKKYAEGGSVSEPNKKAASDFEKGFNDPSPSPSQAWSNLKSGVSEMVSPKKMADGGPVIDPRKAKINEADAMGSGWRPADWLDSAKHAFDPQPEPSPSPKKMADGGEVKQDKGPYFNKKDAAKMGSGSQESDTFSLSEAWNRVKTGLTAPDVDPEQKKAMGGEIRRYAMGTPDGGVAANDDLGYAANSIAGMFGNAPGDNQAGADAHSAALASLPQTPGDTTSAQTATPQDAPPAAAPFGNQVPAAAGGPGQPPVDPNAPPMPGAPPAAPGAAPGAPAPQPGDMSNMSGMSGMGGLGKGYDIGSVMKQEIGGINNLATAQGAAAEKAAEVQRGVIFAQNEAHNAMNESLRNTDEEVNKALAEYKAGKIDSNSIYNNENTGGKILSSISMILGGFGANKDGVNPVVQFMQHAQDKDIEAQVASLGQKKSLVEFNMQKYGNIKDAVAMSQMQMSAIAAARLQEAADSSQSDIAKANAQIAIAQVKKPVAMQMMDFARRDAMFGYRQAAENDPNKIQQYMAMKRAIDPQAASEEAKTIVPGMGFANSPEQATSLIATKNGADAAQIALKKLNDAVSRPNHTLSPEDITDISSNAADLKAKLKPGMFGHGTFTENDQKFLDKVIGDPNSILSWDNVTKRRFLNISQMIDSNLVVEAKNAGIRGADPVQHLTPNQKVAYDYAQKLPDGHEQKPIIMNALRKVTKRPGLN